MAGSLNLFDSTQYTASSEYSSRLGNTVQYLQIHHATMLSLSGLIGMMSPGGREVSANGAMGNDGHLVEVVPLASRAFTSGVASFDRISLTVECCNTTLGPQWGISAATRTRLARLAVAMFRAGLLGSLTRRHIIGHYEVPGTYATACPGPDMLLDAIVAEANAIYNGGGSDARRKGKTMYLARDVGGTIWLYTDNGRAGIASMQVVNLFNRLLYGTTPYDTFNAAELDMMHATVLAAGNSGSDAELAALTKAINSISVTVDSKAVADAVIAAINEQGVEVDTDAVAAAVDAALADNFAAIPKAVIDEIAS